MAFIGSCDVSPEHVVDMEEVRSGEPIRAAVMLHVLGEHFGRYDTTAAALVGRHVASVMAEVLLAMGAKDLLRSGDDLYIGKSKLSVSVATVSAVSICWHFGLNIDGSGAPVDVYTLKQAGVDPLALVGNFFAAWVEEWNGIGKAAVKVRPVL